jgi:hypothetical protein
MTFGDDPAMGFNKRKMEDQRAGRRPRRKRLPVARPRLKSLKMPSA